MLFDRKKGFTLLEITIVVAIISILATISVVGIRSASKATRDAQRKDIINTIKTVLETYRSVNGEYPINPSPNNSAYYITCICCCIGGTTAGPLDGYLSEDLKDPTGPPYSDPDYKDPGNLRYGYAPFPQTWRYFYRREGRTTYTLRVATEAKLPDEPLNEIDFNDWNNNGNYEDFSM